MAINSDNTKDIVVRVTPCAYYHIVYEKMADLWSGLKKECPKGGLKGLLRL